MNSAVLFLDGKKELELATLMVNDKMLIDYTIDVLRRLDLDSIFLIGGENVHIDGVVNRSSIEEIVGDLSSKDGKCLLLSPFYPLIEKEDFLSLIKQENSVFYNEELVPVFCLNNKDIEAFETLEYKAVTITSENSKRFESIKDIPFVWKTIKNRIINKHMNNGVIIEEPDNVSIGIDVKIDKGTIIGPYVSISGKSSIGKNNRIGKGSTIKDSKLGDDNQIDDSKLYDSAIGNNCIIGPNSLVDSKCFIGDNTRVASFVKLSNCRLANDCVVDHLSCLSNTTLRNNVRVGASVTTANNKLTMVGSYSEIGNNVNLISPLYVGSYAFVAAGSTIDKNVENGDLAIARLYQQNKKGYGYKYTKEGQ